jgi:hypothetical protein
VRPGTAGAPTPADPHAAGPRRPGVAASVVGPIVQVAELHPGLQLQLVSVQVVVRAGVELVVFVAASPHHAVLICRELHPIRLTAFEEGVAPHDLQPAGEVREWHGHDAPDVRLAEVSLAPGHVATHAPSGRLHFQRDGRDVLHLPRERVVGVRVLVHIAAGDDRLFHAERPAEVVSHGAEREETPAELAQFPVAPARRIESAAVGPRIDAARDARPRHVLLRKPDVVCQVAPVDCQEVL